MTRARIDEAVGTYKLTRTQRDIVGVLHGFKLWSNTAIGLAYGIDRSIVSRHGKRVAQAFADGLPMGSTPPGP